jgi:hypothetical protein
MCFHSKEIEKNKKKIYKLTLALIITSKITSFHNKFKRKIIKYYQK